MVTGPDDANLDEEATTELCAVCGHADDEHVVEDIEGEIASRVRCLVCEDWHNFVPHPDDA